MSRYHYSPLPPIEELGRTPPYTRVLTLFPSVRSASPISCALEIINLENNSQFFEALSYRWGREQAPEALICGGGRLNITLNLDQALRNLRYRDQSRRLWVDAICINQESHEERARQVAYMRLVYKHALLVTVWLGLKIPGVELAFAFAKTLAELQNELLSNAAGNMELSKIDPSRHPEIHPLMMESLCAEPESADHLERLFEREYFERVWCVQEVIASAVCIVKCEELEMNAFDLLSLSKYVQERQGYRFPTSPLQYWNSLVLGRHRGMIQSNSKTVEGSAGKLLNLLMGIRDFKSTDPRDRIFALQGISDEGLDPVRAFTGIMNGGQDSRGLNMFRGASRWIINTLNSAGPGLDIGRHHSLIPNYDKPVKDVYRDFTRFAVRKSPRVLDVLTHVQHTSDPDDPSWPSWVPKFYEPRSASFMPTSFYISGIPLRGHYGYFAELHDCPLRVEPREPDYLQLDGFRVDEVTAVSEVIQFGLNDPIPVETIWSQIFDIPLFPRPNQKYVIGDEELDIVFFLTLCAGPLGLAFVAASELERVRQGLGSDRVEDARFMTRQMKINILLWLQTQPSANLHSYTDLISIIAEAPDPDQVIGSADVYTRPAFSFTQNKKVYRTRSGLLGVGPQMMKAGDQVVVLFGGGFPFILRPSGNEWVFVGDSYLHHESILMGKEVMAVRSRNGRSRVEAFRLR